MKGKNKEELEEFLKTATIEELKEYKNWQEKELEKIIKANERLHLEQVGLQAILKALKAGNYK